MTQSIMVSKSQVGKPAGGGTLKLPIKIPKFDNSALVQGYAKTMIGRCMNPKAQNMNNLLFMLPRIWNMEERVAGADLGMGRFQFDFDNEEDILEVMKMEPIHFDHWMISLVRWEPRIEAAYPSDIQFWVRIMGVPLHYWAEPTFRSIGEALGKVQPGEDSIDSDNGKVRVTIDGFQPLCFETSIEFDSGEEVPISIRYERLFGFCRRCHSLCHEERDCKVDGINGKEEDKLDGAPRDPENRAKNLSYKGAVANGPQRHKSDDKGYNEEKRNGKRSISEYRESSDNMVRDREENFQRYQGYQRNSGDRGKRFWGNAQGRRRGHYQRGGERRLEEKVTEREEGQCSDVIRPVSAEQKMGQHEEESFTAGKQVRKALFQPDSEVETRALETTIGLNPKLVETSLDTEGDQNGNMMVETLQPIEEPIDKVTIMGDASKEAIHKKADGILITAQTKENKVAGSGEDEAEIREEECVVLMGQDKEGAIKENWAEELGPIVPTRKKMGREFQILKGMSTKKTLVQMLIASPRKLTGKKNNVQIGDGLYPAIPRKEPGNTGVRIPPKKKYIK